MNALVLSASEVGLNPFNESIMRTNVRLCALFMTAAIAAAGQAPAAVVVYNETTHGDLTGSFLSPTDIGPLDVGANTISGAFGFHAATRTFDSDSFDFSIAAGQQLDSVSITLTSLTSGITRSEWRLMDADETFRFATPMASADLSLPANTTIFTAAMPLGPGNYMIFHHSINGFNLNANDVLPSYTFTLNVSGEPTPDPAVVPEPASLAIWGLGALGMAVAARRKRKQA
jgi:hypothetical protein